MLSLDKRARTQMPDRDDAVFAPPFLGVRHSQMVLLDEIVGYINRGALIREQWHLAPDPEESDKSFADRSLGLFQDRMLSARSQDLFAPKVAYGFFPVNSAGDDLIVWDDDSRRTEQMRLRLQRASGPCVADLFKPAGEPDYAALMIATLGSRLSSNTPRLYAGEMRQSYVALYGLGLAVLEAFNEYWHRRIRYEWGFGFEDGPSLTLLFDHFYRGERYVLNGTPHGDAESVAAVVALLEGDRIGVMTSRAGLHPELTAVSLVAHDPRALPLLAG